MSVDASHFYGTEDGLDSFWGEQQGHIKRRRVEARRLLAAKEQQCQACRNGGPKSLYDPLIKHGFYRRCEHRATDVFGDIPVCGVHARQARASEYPPTWLANPKLTRRAWRLVTDPLDAPRRRWWRS